MHAATVTQFYSLRSPYSWLAFHRAQRILPSLGVSVRNVAVFPPPGVSVGSTSTRRA